MRIAMVSTLARTVPPQGEGAIELLVSLLTERLVAKGHDVTLYAIVGSQTAAKLRSPVPRSYVGDPEKWDWQLYESLHVREAFREWRDFDVIHCHSYHFGMLFSDFVPIPSIHSLHTEPGPDNRLVAEKTKRRHLHFASKYQARDFRDLPDVHIVPHGVAMEDFFETPKAERGGYLAYLGRFHPDKGAAAAVALSRRTGIPLKLAGPPNDYLKEVVLHKADKKLVEYVGEVFGPAKSEFLSRARALVYPVLRGEPFGLVLIEALASGLPVVAFDKGAVPEIVEHGVTGWIGNAEASLAAGVALADTLDRGAIRRRAEELFSADLMTDRIEALMRDVVEREGAESSAGAKAAGGG